jgi:hypothetical protein
MRATIRSASCCILVLTGFMSYADKPLLKIYFKACFCFDEIQQLCRQTIIERFASCCALASTRFGDCANISLGPVSLVKA